MKIKSNTLPPALTESRQKARIKSGAAPLFALYRITNISTGRAYIGMTNDLKRRIARHHSELRSGVHVNVHMQKDWNEGHTDLEYEVVHTEKNVVMARFLETELMNAETNPYNIRKGNPGDMLETTQHFTYSYRAYLYKEVADLYVRYDYTVARIRELFKISQPLVSMIVTGKRQTTAPQTSFGTVFSCETTAARVEKPKKSKMMSFYKEQNHAY